MLSVAVTGVDELSAAPAITAGVNVTVMVQLADGATFVQSLLCANWPAPEPVMPTAAMLSELLPELVTVTASPGEVVFIDCPPKSIEVRDRLTEGTAVFATLNAYDATLPRTGALARSVFRFGASRPMVAKAWRVCEPAPSPA